MNRLWREWILCGGACPVLLNPTQELAIWEIVIRESRQGKKLLQIPETAQAAMDAWQLIHSYRLPIRSGQFSASEDCEAFLQWSREFERRRDENNWLEQARLPETIADLLLRKKLPAPQSVYAAGFDEITPQQQAVFEALGPILPLPLETFEAVPKCLELRDTSAELRRAADWARERLESNPEARIGIIVPDLARLRSRTTRIFAEAFHAGARADSDSKSFHLSLGAPLSESPMVNAALLILTLAGGNPTLPEMGLLLRSPWIAGAERERSQRALLDAGLRRSGIFRIPFTTVRENAAACPVLEAALEKLQRQVDNLAHSQGASTWARMFSLLLSAIGWPGEGTLSSREFQASRAWQEALSRFATLDAIAGPMEYGEALDRLRQITRTTLFQPEDEGAPIQIMGLFESSGLRFDHLWVMGLHDEALPGPARPNPFLPIKLQRAHKLPHSSPARELEVASMVMRRLSASAPEIVFSYPAQEGDQKLAPSPFLRFRQNVEETQEPRVYGRWVERIRAASVLESFQDTLAPPLPADTLHSGGTSLLRDAAACSFRAWAIHRAGAKPLEDADAGISARYRGIAVHEALRLIWEELKTAAALRSRTPEEIADLVARHVSEALRQTPGMGRALEQRLLERRLRAWLEIEKRRAPFTIVECERKESITLGGLIINARIDRIDQLDDGRRVVIDYKTGEVKKGVWLGDRPDEPQLPLYCTNNGHRIAGVTFVQIRAGDLGFIGISEETHLLPDMKKMKIDNPAPLCEQIENWRSVLGALAENFCAGRAEVNPKRNACDYCKLTALCRIRDDFRSTQS